LHIRTLQNAPRTVPNSRLHALFEIKIKEKGEAAADIEYTQGWLQREIENGSSRITFLNQKINRIALVSKIMKI
jgi:hypothetical protein